jgi:FkbM family methyltransferase
MPHLAFKTRIKGWLQTLLGYERFLRAFAWFKARTLRWDPREAGFFRFLDQLPRDGVVVDVGANLGFLCVHLARRVARGRVLAFEPLPDNHRTLRWMLRRFGLTNVTVFPWALGERPGSVGMILPVRGRAREQGLGHIVDPADGCEPGVAFDVPLRRLDDLAEVNEPGIRIAGIKIDVEDFERFVLRGARGLLARDRPIVYLELWDGPNRRESFALAEELGYDVCVDDGHGLVAFDAARHGNQGNFFLMPRRPLASAVRTPARAPEPGVPEVSPSVHNAWGN